jgi:hypothetical protein
MLVTDPYWEAQGFEVAQVVSSAGILKLKPTEAEGNALAEAFLQAVNLGNYSPTHAVAVIHGYAAVGLIPQPDTLRALFRAGTSRGVTPLLEDQATSSLINNGMYAVRQFATVIPGGKDTLLQYKEDYTQGCEVLLEALLLLSPGKVKSHHAALILREAAILTSINPPLLDKAMLCRLAPRV